MTFQDTIVGLVVPPDLNKLAARTFLYNLLAQLEMEIAERIREYFEDDDEDLLDFLEAHYSIGSDDSKRIQDARTKLREMQQMDIEIASIHLLYLSDFAIVIREVDELRTILGFESKKKAKSKL